MQLFPRPPLSQDESHFKAGLRHRDRNKKEFDLGLAVEYFKEAIRLNPGIGSYYAELGKAYVAAPLLAVTRGISDSFKLDECIDLAIEALDKALEMDASQAETYLVIGEAYLYKGNVAKAEAALRFAANISSVSVLLLSPLSFIDGRLFKSYAERRLKVLQEGSGERPAPDLVEEHLRQAMAYRDEGKYRMADTQLRQAFRLAPDWAWLYKTIRKVVG
jgi:tetratricopeptide (TPR) repeat protein